jgi:hypothetical protein
MVLGALNGDSHHGQRAMLGAYRRRAVIVLIKRIQQVEAAAANIRFELWTSPSQRGGIATLRATPEWEKLQPKLERFLMRYHASPRIRLHPVLKPGVQAKTPFWGLTWEAQPGTRFWYEVRLLDAVFQIARNGGINALRQCDQCQRWKYARRPAKDRFCSPECRELFHRTNEADKARRRNWARENYQTRKTLEAGSTKAANQRKIRNTGRKSK